MIVALPVNDVTVLPCYPEMANRVRALAEAGESDAKIARILTAEGFRSPTRTTRVLPNTVGRIRRDFLHLPSQAKSARWDLPTGWLSITTVAQRLEIPTKWLHACIRHGTIQIDRHPGTGRHLFPDTEETFQILRQLRARGIPSANFKTHQPYEEGHHYG
ncbi:MAG TPA: hypothetical protein VK558_03575 [Patescibacteria group bacterium]|nr:hypothetical protein [Patescibacteria group bacterium]